MKTRLLIAAALLLIFSSCGKKSGTIPESWVPYDETEEIMANSEHPSPKMRFTLIQSRILDKNAIWKVITAQIKGFTEEDYEELKPLILEQDIPSIQEYISSGRLTYEKLTQWYLYRIIKYENNRNSCLNNIIAINPYAVREARLCDRNRTGDIHPLYGMPVLLKDNIGAEGMTTTAGAAALKDNMTSDAFIVKRIKARGGIILGKANLSEWANYLSSACPNGYSAVGGQTLNPYGRKRFDTGGSSSGSGTAMAACYAAAAVGTETSGSILSPSSANSVVGLKPTVGLLSRSGIVPLSGTLDTPGPMTRNVTDNAILLSAMTGEDSTDPVTTGKSGSTEYWHDLASSDLTGMRFGIISDFMSDSLYIDAVEVIRDLGGIIVEIKPGNIGLDGFRTLLSGDMKSDLPEYLNNFASRNITLREIQEFIDFNSADSLVRIPYGQTIFRSMAALEITDEKLDSIRQKLHEEAVGYFEKPMRQDSLDVILSVNNRSAGVAAAAFYPCLTVPMGYRATGEPAGLTFIAEPLKEEMLLRMGYTFEKSTRKRILPEQFR